MIEDRGRDKRVCGECEFFAQDGPSARAACAPAEPLIRAYLAVPVYGPGHQALGALAAIHHAPRMWDEKDLGFMVDLADCVRAQLKSRGALQQGY